MELLAKTETSITGYSYELSKYSYESSKDSTKSGFAVTCLLNGEMHNFDFFATLEEASQFFAKSKDQLKVI